MKTTLTALLDAHAGLISLRQNPDATRLVRRAVTRGDLVRLLPGTYSRPEPGFDVRARAVRLADADAVLDRLSALALHRWIDVPDGPIFASSVRLHSQNGYVFQRRLVPRHLARFQDGVRFTSRALTAVDLIPELGPGIVDEALRRRVDLNDLRIALDELPHRRGHAQRRQVLTESRDRPWSAAERAAHKALRVARVPHWTANFCVSVSDWQLYYLDIAFRRVRLGIEIDGREHHSTWDAVAADHRRDRQLAAAGWHMVRFPAAEVLRSPGKFVREVTEIVARRRSDFG